MHPRTNSEKRTEEESLLWTALRASDRNALGKLFDAYVRELLTYGYRMSRDMALTKDAVQDVFVDLWAYRETLSPTVEVRFYLYSCLRRTLLKQLKNRQPLSTDWAEAEMNSEPSAETQWMESETGDQQRAQISSGLQALSNREYEVVSLKYYTGLKIRQIATLLNLKEQTVANTLQNALLKLRKHLVHLLFLYLLF
ncbi:RNA polymerase sigma factor [Larkinella rosea]|uniref:Sigma-70 family RNA polymerase sigma factor n=1 Tax=Larkinella rosea TaxID=2025312 RepID=A0A3P1BAJ3_9BACT|nr:sigma-70 family RNA polymerase sigma factor [Larkinella rosea]RRA98100.1 sigma-70 family RNA polymerase sigma factor [Larkinella rosea]